MSFPEPRCPRVPVARPLLQEASVVRNGEDATRLLLVRHGQIQANIDRIWHGSTDSGLTPIGEEEARRVAEYLARTEPGVSHLYCSPLQRTTRTADAIGRALGLVPAHDPDLREYGIGELEGQSYQSLYTDHGFFDRIRRDSGFAPGGGESPRAVGDRMVAAFERISGAHPGRVVAIVTHGAALALALARLVEGDPLDWQRFHSRNCSVTELILEPQPTLVRFDVSDHLE